MIKLKQEARHMRSHRYQNVSLQKVPVDGKQNWDALGWEAVRRPAHDDHLLEFE